jgi:hypothetical protein
MLPYALGCFRLARRFHHLEKPFVASIAPTKARLSLRQAQGASDTTEETSWFAALRSKRARMRPGLDDLDGGVDLTLRG